MNNLHNWNVTPRQAIQIQKRLADRVIRQNRIDRVKFVAGVDVGFESGGKLGRAAVVILNFPGLDMVESVIAREPVSFPYIPGLLSFRELPVILKACRKIKQKPDLVLCDGQGIAHPRRIGVASHLGLLLDIPTIGVGKTRLVGHYREPGPKKGDWEALVHYDETVGAALRSRADIKPIFISTGHRVSLKSSIKYVMACLTRYKLPETTRCAHRLASEKRP